MWMDVVCCLVNRGVGLGSFRVSVQKVGFTLTRRPSRSFDVGLSLLKVPIRRRSTTAEYPKFHGSALGLESRSTPKSKEQPNSSCVRQEPLSSPNMGKRVSHGPDGGVASRKRQKIVHEAPTSEEIFASRQLQQLLAFSQDPVRARHGMSTQDDGITFQLTDLLNPTRLAILQALPRRVAQFRQQQC